jgi:hypothetical protein
MNGIRRSSLRRCMALIPLALMAACGSGTGDTPGGGTGPTTHLISGTVSGTATSGVTVALAGTSSATTTTGAGGTYSFTALADGAYTVTPSLAGYTFTPANASVTLAGADATGKNFVAATVPVQLSLSFVWSYVDDLFTVSSTTYAFPSGAVVESASGAQTLSSPVTFVPPTTYVADAFPGPYTVVAGSNRFVVWSGARSFDLGEDRGGRGDVVYPNLETVVTFNLTGLLPWDRATDWVQLFSGGARAWDIGDPGLPAGATSGTMSYFWDGTGGLLVPGDRTWLVQYRTMPLAGTSLTYRRAVAVTSVTGVTLTNGTPATINPPAFVPSPASGFPCSLAWRTTQFESTIPAGSSPSHYFSIWAGPNSATGGSTTSLWNSASVNLTDIAIPAPSADRALSFEIDRFLGQPPPSPDQVTYAEFSNSVGRTAPGATSPFTFLQWALQMAKLPAVSSQTSASDITAAPLVGGVRNIVVTRAGPSGPVTVNWAPPAIGTATSYRVTFYRLGVNGTATTSTRIGDVDTNATQVVMPASLQTAGASYVALVWAFQNPANTDGSAPFRTGLPYGESRVLSDVF